MPRKNERLLMLALLTPMLLASGCASDATQFAAAVSCPQPGYRRCRQRPGSHPRRHGALRSARPVCRYESRAGAGL